MSILNIDKKTFDEKMQNKSTILIEFWAPWCVYCKRIGPAFSKIAQQYEGKLEIGQVNIDEEPQLAVQFKAMTIPMLVVMDQGKVVTTSVGAKPKAAVKKLLA